MRQAASEQASAHTASRAPYQCCTSTGAQSRGAFPVLRAWRPCAWACLRPMGRWAPPGRSARGCDGWSGPASAPITSMDSRSSASLMSTVPPPALTARSTSTSCRPASTTRGKPALRSRPPRGLGKARLGLCALAARSPELLSRRCAALRPASVPAPAGCCCSADVLAKQGCSSACSPPC